jgi:hypothetical protein
MSIDIPQSEIKNQIHTDVIDTVDDTLVDDTVMLVDGSGLVGGPTTPIDNLSQTLDNKPPKATMIRRR